jgi:predicted membrane-bound mannosyltransferase
LEGKPIGLDQKNELKGELMVWRTKVLLISSLIFVVVVVVFFYTCYSKFVSMEDILWITNIVGNTRAPLFLTNFRIDMVGLWILIWWLLKRVHFQPFQVHEMKVRKKEKKKRYHEKKKRRKGKNQ